MPRRFTKSKERGNGTMVLYQPNNCNAIFRLFFSGMQMYKAVQARIQYRPVLDSNTGFFPPPPGCSSLVKSQYSSCEAHFLTYHELQNKSPRNLLFSNFFYRKRDDKKVDRKSLINRHCCRLSFAPRRRGNYLSIEISIKKVTSCGHTVGSHEKV